MGGVFGPGGPEIDNIISYANNEPIFCDCGANSGVSEDNKSTYDIFKLIRSQFHHFPA